MKRRPKRLFVLFMRLCVWTLCGAAFFLVLSLGNPYLLILNRTSVIVALVYTVTYFLMKGVYGGFDIGTRKSPSIIFSMALVQFFTDLVAHLFLCIMDYTVINAGHFVYEHPHLLALALVLQVAIVSGMAYLGNGLYFMIKKPQFCVMIVRKGDEFTDWVRKVGRFRKQYNIQRIAYTTDPDIFEWIDRSDAVFIYNLAESERSAYVEYCYQKHKDLYYSMELADVVMFGGEQIYFDDSAMIFAAAEKMSVEEELIKRLMDILLSALGLLITSPLLLVTAAAIRLEDGGEIFYRQERTTYGGQVFSIVKFRSMRQEVGDIHQSVTEDDDRITRVGRVIRKFRIDELPQLWNVLRGEMSLVGPRPEMVENMEKYTEELPQFVYRLRMKAGMTGLAQVYGRYNSGPREKLIMDLLYIENYSIWLDIKMILRTFLVLLTPERSTAAFEDEEEEKELDPELKRLLDRE